MKRVTSVVIGTNADLIAEFARLCIRPDDVVMDVTYGRGKCWKKYQHPGPFITHDLNTDGVDFRHPPEADHSVDVVVADPPHGAQGGRTTSTVPDSATATAWTPRSPAPRPGSSASTPPA